MQLTLEKTGEQLLEMQQHSKLVLPFDNVKILLQI